MDEKQVQLKEDEKIWLYTAIDVDSKVVLHARVSEDRGTDPIAEFLRELHEKLHDSNTEFLVDGVGYLAALA